MKPNRSILFLLAGLLGMHTAGAQVMHEYEFKQEAVYEVRTALGITTQIALDPGEEIKDFSTGFSSGWDLLRRDNVFYLKPRNVDVDTNMTVRTARHDYFFELKVVATDWTTLEQAKRAGVHYRVSFRYPKDRSFEDPAADPAPSAPVQPVEHGQYSYAARRAVAWLVPESVHDDGSFTRIRLGSRNRFPSGDFPAVFGRATERGEDFVVNATIEGDTIMVHGTYPYLVLRHGRNVVGLRRDQEK